MRPPFISRVDEGFSYQWDIWDHPESTNWNVWDNWQRIHGMTIDETTQVKRLLDEYERNESQSKSCETLGNDEL
jgi:hypothetical protein